MQPVDLTQFKGLVSTIVLSGTVHEEFAMCRENMRAFNIEQGFTRVEYRNFNAVLVEHGRDEALQHAVNERYDWCLQIDADATFPPDALARILQTAFVTVPNSDVVGGYAQLKHAPFLPTIDSGSGTWEPIFPGEGVLPVIRTGAHFVLVKPRILSRFGPPWFRTRRSMRPIDALRDVDNYARIKLDGANPLSELDAWQRLMDEAKGEAGGTESPVGEDSGFCDALKAAGGAIFVDTNLVIGHLSKRLVTPQMLKEAKDEEMARYRAAVGVYEMP
jgi:hypothetical protein